MKVVVLGNSGMLGGMVEKILKKNNKLEVKGIGRETLELSPMSLNLLGAKLSKFVGFDADYVINCLGAIKPTFKSSTDITVPLYVNSIFPHQLSNWASLINTVKIIHITTDCVYSGRKGSYIESDAHDALDEYGKSKSLGEPPNCMVIRTSIFGPEFGGRKRSFFEWVLSQKNSEANGFTNHFWNGITTLELANCLNTLVTDDIYEEGTFHLFSGEVTKHYMVERISDLWELGIKLKSVEAPDTVNRTLNTEKSLNNLLEPLDFNSMLRDLLEFTNGHIARN